jgi:DNA-binding IscR family transcriptional regulator
LTHLTRHAQRVNVGGVVAQVNGSVELVALDQLPECAAFVDRNGRA